jgi:hypothetical protein
MPGLREGVARGEHRAPQGVPPRLEPSQPREEARARPTLSREEASGPAIAGAKASPGPTLSGAEAGPTLRSTTYARGAQSRFLSGSSAIGSSGRFTRRCVPMRVSASPRGLPVRERTARNRIVCTDLCTRDVCIGSPTAAAPKRRPRASCELASTGSHRPFTPPAGDNHHPSPLRFVTRG